LAEELGHRPGRNDDQRRRYYRLTTLGQDVCLTEADRLERLVYQSRTNLRPRMA
jgi:hypothetical protein